MSTILIGPFASRVPTPRKPFVLVIEPEVVRAQALRNLVTGHVGAECDAVDDVAAAIKRIATRVPNLVLTSTFLPPQDEAALTACLRELPAAAHVQIVCLPYLVDWPGESAGAPRKVLKFLRRRAMLARPCAPDVVARQIEEYLEARPTLPSSRTHIARSSGTSLDPAREGTHRPPAGGERPNGPDEGCVFSQRVHKLGRAYANDRRTARRMPACELPWLWSITLPSGSNAKVVDVSRLGALLETTSKVGAGTALDLRLVGQDIDLRIPARITRTEVASVDSSGVRYRLAAAFASGLDIRGLEMRAVGARVKPAAVTDLLSRVLRQAETGASPATLRSSYEDGLRQLLPIEEVRIRQTPVVPPDGCESIYFTVPIASGPQPIVQTIFAPDSRPTADEFRVLKTAASLAAVLLEFAPLSGEQTGAPGTRPEAFDPIRVRPAGASRH